jgi:SAM-dependent methyltransferase
LAVNTGSVSAPASEPYRVSTTASMSLRTQLQPYLLPTAEVDWSDPTMPCSLIRNRTSGLEANRRYFSQPEWANRYFNDCHRSEQFRQRCLAATGSWNGKVVVDIGCGPGNVFATVGGRPELLIGVDVARGSLDMARELGYLPMAADAHELPFVSGIADIVVLNATLHHCDNMPRVLAEAARLVAHGGLLVSDHDPQLTAWNFRGLAKWAWDFRLTPNRWLKRGFHRSVEEQSLALQGEVHHYPGRGVTAHLYESVLKPIGFNLELYPHNHDRGASVLEGDIGRSTLRHRIAQSLSGIDPDSREAALSILCRATRHRVVTANSGAYPC